MMSCYTVGISSTPPGLLRQHDMPRPHLATPHLTPLHLAHTSPHLASHLHTSPHTNVPWVILNHARNVQPRFIPKKQRMGRGISPCAWPGLAFLALALCNCRLLTCLLKTCNDVTAECLFHFSPPANDSNQQLFLVLESKGLADVVEWFIQNQLDGQALLELSVDDMEVSKANFDSNRDISGHASRAIPGLLNVFSERTTSRSNHTTRNVPAG